MTDDTTITPFPQPGSIIDPLTEVARDGARPMQMAALKAEADGFVARFSEDLLAMAASASFGMVPDQSALSRPGSG